MSKDKAPLAKVVELRRWREEKGRTPAPAAPPPPPEPPRFGRLLRALSFLAGVVLIALCLDLASILWSVDEGRGCALAVLAPLFGVAVFGLHLLAWGILGRPWARDFWGRVGSWIARKVLLRARPGQRRPHSEPPAAPPHPRGVRDGRSPDS